MPFEDPKAVSTLKAWKRQLTIRQLYEPLWQQIADYIFPRKSNILNVLQPGAKQTRKVFNATAIHANELLAASMQGALTSSAFPWFSLRIRGLGERANKEANDWLVGVSDTLYDLFRQSNFNSEMQEYYLDLSAFGTGGILIEGDSRRPGKVRLRFRTLTIGGYCIEENAEGIVDVLYRDFRLTARAAVAKWGLENLGKKTQEIFEKTPEKMLTFLHCVRPRGIDKRLPGGRNMPFSSIYIDLTDKTTITEGGFEEFPYIVSRWSKTSGESWGRGPGHTALPDVMTLNKAVELKLKGLAKAIDPPVMVRDAGVIGAVKMIPGGLTHMRDMEAIKAMDTNGRFDVAQVEEAVLKDGIEKIFFSDQLQLREGPQMTATEVQVRFELMQRLLGPTLGRLESEGFNPIIERVFNIAVRSGVLEPPPLSVVEHHRAVGGGKIIDIEYEGPLARSQRQVNSLAVQRFYELALPIAESKPDVLDNVDADKVIQLHAHAVGVPSDLLRSSDQVDVIRQAREDAEAAQAEQEEAMQTAESLKNTAPLVKALDQAQTTPQELAGVG